MKTSQTIDTSRSPKSQPRARSLNALKSCSISPLSRCFRPKIKNLSLVTFGSFWNVTVEILHSLMKFISTFLQYGCFWLKYFCPCFPKDQNCFDFNRLSASPRVDPLNFREENRLVIRPLVFFIPPCCYSRRIPCHPICSCVLILHSSRLFQYRSIHFIAANSQYLFLLLRWLTVGTFGGSCDGPA